MTITSCERGTFVADVGGAVAIRLTKLCLPKPGTFASNS
jgi:hypothetical protein